MRFNIIDDSGNVVHSFDVDDMDEDAPARIQNALRDGSDVVVVVDGKKLSISDILENGNAHLTIKHVNPPVSPDDPNQLELPFPSS